ncbi:MAG: hypothetical protein KDD82_29250, partial [Planctomycetes bacterium]|nr:hypothetical protein [Planctomycetota bacterium]
MSAARFQALACAAPVLLALWAGVGERWLGALEALGSGCFAVAIVLAQRRLRSGPVPTRVEVALAALGAAALAIAVT